MTTTVAEKPEAAPAPLTKAAVKLPRQELKREEQVRTPYVFFAPPGCVQTDVVHPDFWSNVSEKLRRHDVVFIISDEAGWEMECRVESVRQSGADVSVWKVGSRTAIQQAQKWLDTDHYLQWRPSDSWCVVRAKDDCLLVRGQGTEGGALNAFYASRPKAA